MASLDFPFVILTGGRAVRMTRHAVEQLADRNIRESWIVQTLTEPVAVVDDERKNSTGYYGIIPGRKSLLKVAVSKAKDQPIVTAHFDTAATLRYERGEL